MDRLVDHLFVFEGDGEIQDYPGNYSQYREWEKVREIAPLVNESKLTAPLETINTAPKKKRSFKEQRELDQLQQDLLSLDTERKNITEKLSSADIKFDELQKLSQRISEIAMLIDEKELRWLELSEE
jgi:ATP-binding cassette subfamily F protein uup